MSMGLAPDIEQIYENIVDHLEGLYSILQEKDPVTYGIYRDVRAPKKLLTAFAKLKHIRNLAVDPHLKQIASIAVRDLQSLIDPYSPLPRVIIQKGLWSKLEGQLEGRQAFIYPKKKKKGSNIFGGAMANPAFAQLFNAWNSPEAQKKREEMTKNAADEQ